MSRCYVSQYIQSTSLLAFLVAAFVVFASQLSSAAELPNDDALWAGANDRIEKHRKADATIRVVDASGKPVSDATVEIEQTQHAFLFGCNIFAWGPAERQRSASQETAELQQKYRERFAELLNFATLPFYWQSYERQRGEPNHDYTERVAQWCGQHGIRTKGHPLAWNHADPRWLPDDSEEIRRLQMARIDDCVARFKGLIDTWDVVNEVTHFDREDFVQRRAPKHSRMWQQVGQIDFTKQCFQHARQANPQATLLINDYRVDPPYEKVIEQLVDQQGKPLYDVIGIQSHQHGGTWTNRKIWEVCERYAHFGVPLHFTETTILSGEPGWQKRDDWPNTPEREQWQAKEVTRFYTMLFSHPAVEAVTWWDFSDRHAWKSAPAGLIRADMSPKPAFTALKELIKDRWWTRTSQPTNDQGIAQFRGFLGDYQITVTHKGKPVGKGVLVVERGKQSQCTITVNVESAE